MRKTFNIAGPCNPDEHYMLPAQERCGGLIDLIEQKQYFVIHAARQSGKTTLLLELTQQLNETGNYYVLYCSLESVQEITEAEKGIPAIIKVMKTQVRFHKNLRKYAFADKIDYADFNVALRESLSYFCESLDKPLVVLFDEINCLSNGALISFLRQLRDGYINRRDIPFVHSIALVGLRNIRDYKAKIREPSEKRREPSGRLGTSSPFNIVKTSKTLRNFTLDEIAELYAQHTQETTQAFSPKVIQRVYHYTQGQPWLVNAIACEIVEQILNFEISREILPEHVEQAVQTLTMRRDTHLDSLMERLKEARVQRIVEPVILGEAKGYDWQDDDYQYVLDLGLLREDDEKGLVPSNPIYGEVIIHILTARSQMELKKRHFPPAAPAYLLEGKLDMKRLLKDFQQFWRENSEIWAKRYQYQEAAPHLILQAFLQQVVITGGRISRELAGGRGSLDLCVHYEGGKYPIELKLRYGNKTYQEGKEQLAGYMDRLDCQEGWLIVFDRRKTPKWDKKIFWKTSKLGGKTIYIVGC
ncbi:MAG: AAA-like domain-containing protein [Pseudomonadota bacterium]